MANPNLPGTVVRLPMVYGAKDIRHRFYSYLQRMDDRRCAIVLEESIARWRGSYGYVENVAYALA
jgi:nucleoside-diphosphate-sugar epimerase